MYSAARPTSRSTPACRVAYVDNDPLVLVHARKP
jgi:S-adenosyl methyltransferase